MKDYFTGQESTGYANNWICDFCDIINPFGHQYCVVCFKKKAMVKISPRDIVCLCGKNFQGLGRRKYCSKKCRIEYSNE